MGMIVCAYIHVYKKRIACLRAINLEGASGNRLRAFVRNLEARGEACDASALSPPDATKIFLGAESENSGAASGQQNKWK